MQSIVIWLTTLAQGDVLVSSIALLASGLQVLGYIVYVKKTLRFETDPNATSWLIWSYGTALVFFMELLHGASWAAIALLGFCALSSLSICFIIWRRRGAAGFKKMDAIERRALFSDLAITALYLFAQTSGNERLEIGSIWLVSVTAWVSFIPILRSTWKRPENERWEPWVIWTSAYILLLLTSILAGEPVEIWAYPIVIGIFSALMALFLWAPFKAVTARTLSKLNRMV